MEKGSKDWFLAISRIVGDDLVGLEVSHYSKDDDVIPRCQVAFVLREFYVDKIPPHIINACEFSGCRMFHHKGRGVKQKNSASNLRHTLLFDFRDDETCPREIMLEVATELAFTVAPEFLNDSVHTARLSPTIYE